MIKRNWSKLCVGSPPVGNIHYWNFQVRQDGVPELRIVSDWLAKAVKFPDNCRVSPLLILILPAHPK
jgi:hypothetical protein